VRVYSALHAFTRGVGPHGRTLDLCVLDRARQVVLPCTLPWKKDGAIAALAPRLGDSSTDRRGWQEGTKQPGGRRDIRS